MDWHSVVEYLESVIIYFVGPAPQRPVTEYTMPPNNVYGIPTPTEASTAPDDTETWYCDFWEKASAVPHKDGKSIIIYEPKETEYPDPRVRPEWPSKRLQKAYELLGEGHPRIVRCISPVNSEAGNGVIVERLNPGPHWGELPVMTLPYPEKPSRKDQMMLALYYRWALQALSAIGFFHSRAMHLTFFSSTNVWLRSDYSLAITGFINVNGPELAADSEREARREAKFRERHDRPSRDRELELSDEDNRDDNEEILERIQWPWDTGEQIGDASLFYEEYHRSYYRGEEGNLRPRESLFYWATFVWELMTNTHTTEAHWKRGIVWDPCSPPEGGAPDRSSKDWRDQLQVLEETRLGSVLFKAWKCEYDSAEQVAEDIRKIAEEVGIKVVSSEVEVDNDWMKVYKDEVDIGEPWEDVFELGEAEKKWGARTIRFKRKASHVSSPATEENVSQEP